MPDRQLIVTPDVAAEAQRQIEAASPRTIALAGGSTPRGLYERLGTGSSLDWPNIDVFFGDERCVPPDHPDSNFRMAYEALLSKVRARVHTMPGATCDALASEADLRSIFGEGTPAFDLILLGLGEDGHTASLFPGDPALEVRDHLVVRVTRPDHPRLTLTLPVLKAARLVLFLVAGASKREALRRLLNNEDIPAARVHAARTLVISDPPAAG
jgi:6-phosphogluconolactonase